MLIGDKAPSYARKHEGQRRTKRSKFAKRQWLEVNEKGKVLFMTMPYFTEEDQERVSERVTGFAKEEVQKDSGSKRLSRKQVFFIVPHWRNT